MHIESNKDEQQKIIYGEESFEEFLNRLSNQQKQTEETYHLALLIGTDDQRKEDAIKQISKASDRDVKEIDANEIITKIESETKANIDRTFKNYDATDSILYLKNGSRMCGVYTGYTHSRVKYATPQERYFLKKMQKTGGFIVIDIAQAEDADKTMQRAAQSVVEFPLPQSMFKKLMNRLKGVSVHGYEIDTDRPEHYNKTSENF